MNFKNKKIILFDLDGTITESGEGIVNSIEYALKAFGITDYNRADLFRHLGPPIIEIFKNEFGFDDLKALEAVEKFREYFREIGIYENKLYDGIESLLKSISDSGRKIVLATSKAEVFAVRILEYFNIINYFDVVGGSELDGSRIRKGDVIRYALNKAGIVDLDSAVMVGDRKEDILGAKEAGIDSIGVLYGYGSFEELKNAGAVTIVGTVEELGKVLIG
ncbi:HAD-IA family hydrolase [Acetivibrio clariflavus]|uniref:Haloacid dehalogenase superfamily enzyme, subfamily IA n=1 Tax=Acetivibrio clariflavus (strain DSM 19732 / NBRC 101661 / EBR45) TaxID=720554 RepID=G8LWX9_ACECE|nr:HAD-IA family hydrolase [Acetivibrio clariflavus]AEV67631.1 haloacid dehalogenase superfamily enzyme, subfamily IA [Acetivibrio clariflavus DSM 19732]